MKNHKENIAFDAGKSWLLKSIEVCQGKGSSAFYHTFRGWQSAYPETTGYIIPTLLQLYKKDNNPIFLEYAISCSDWLLTLQLENGSFPGGVGEASPPTIFDTGQIILGLTSVYAVTREEKYLSSLKRAVLHLLEILEEDGSWQKEAYTPHYIPSYYTRVIWAVLAADRYLELSELKPKMKLALTFYTNRINSNYTVQNWAFKPDEKALTHTIAYTIRGFLESALILDDAKLLNITREVFDKLFDIVQNKGKLAGSYDDNWQGDYSFICVPGHFQLSIIASRFFELTGEVKYQRFALRLLKEGKKGQCMLPFENIHGGFAGSFPFWGKYQRFKLLNWGAKFYLDAHILLCK